MKIKKLIFTVIVLFFTIQTVQAQDFWGFNPLELKLGTDIFEFEEGHVFMLLSEELRPELKVASYYMTEFFGDPVFMTVITKDSLITGISILINDIPEPYTEGLFEYLDVAVQKVDNNWMFWSFVQETETSLQVIWSRAYCDYVLTVVYNIYTGYYDFVIAKLKRFIIKVPYDNKREME